MKLYFVEHDYLFFIISKLSIALSNLAMTLLMKTRLEDAGYFTLTHNLSGKIKLRF